jgi:coproporphyrinogen III oxidase-like Fe-S oxidoreductase
MALKPPYNVDDRILPLPVWAQRPYTERGKQAWQILCQDLNNFPADKPFCIYIHSPFCASKCGFCDSYSFRLGSHRAERISDYIGKVIAEMRLWSEQGNLARRPVSTVHFGGGTPTFLGEEPFRSLIENCVARFATSPNTEWALESTVSDLSTEMLGRLYDWGFRRLHLGVQSLEDVVRQEMGRKSSAAQALAKTTEAIEMGWVVSVDLICGLPGQTLAGFIGGIKALWQLGVHGFSLYELLIYPQNRKWAERHGLTKRGHLMNYWMFQAGAGYLETLGYKKNLFNHWANPKDQNVYFTFPTRGEDLLAIGTIADGVFGDYHYRHPRYQDYLTLMRDDFPALEGGLRRNVLENRLHLLATAILAGSIPLASVPALEVGGLDSDTILQRWIDLALVEKNTRECALSLTTNGSWFTGNMVSELASAYKSLAYNP